MESLPKRFLWRIFGDHGIAVKSQHREWSPPSQFFEYHLPRGSVVCRNSWRERSARDWGEDNIHLRYSTWQAGSQEIVSIGSCSHSVDLFFGPRDPQGLCKTPRLSENSRWPFRALATLVAGCGRFGPVEPKVKLVMVVLERIPSGCASARMSRLTSIPRSLTRNEISDVQSVFHLKVLPVLCPGRCVDLADSDREACIASLSPERWNSRTPPSVNKRFHHVLCSCSTCTRPAGPALRYQPLLGKASVVGHQQPLVNLENRHQVGIKRKLAKETQTHGSHVRPHWQDRWPD